MHVGGGLANDEVRFELPSAFGHGVSPVIFSPAGTGWAWGTAPAAAVVVAPGAVVAVVDAVVDAVVEDALFTSVLLLSLRLAMTSAAMTTAAMTPPTISRRRFCRIFWARWISCWRTWRPSRCRRRFSVGTAGQGSR